VRKVVHGNDRRVDVCRPGNYFGELALLLGSPAIASLRALEESRVAQLVQEDFFELFARCKTFQGELTSSMTRRFGELRRLAEEELPPSVTIVGHPYDIACHHLRDFLTRNRIIFRWIDPTRPKDSGNFPAPLPGDRFPVVILPGGERLQTPSLRELAEKLRLKTKPANTAYDVAIIGAGPAGLAAAVYGASEGLRTLLVEREAPGGQAGTSSRIENYLGFPTGVSGDELGFRALQQAQRFGAELLVAREVVDVQPATDGGDHAILLDGKETVHAHSLVVATGVAWRQLEVPGADALVGRGIYYGAARTEALNCAGQHVFLVGGGNSAGQAAMFFSSYAARVSLLVRGKSLASSMSHYLIEQLRGKANVEICTNCRIVKVEGETRLEAIHIDDRDTGEVVRMPTSAVFVFIGADAQTGWLPKGLLCDDLGFLCTGRDVLDLVRQKQVSWPLERDPFLLETSAPGIFAAGDVRHGSVKRVASGVGEGSMAIAFVHQYLASRQPRAGA
jgi:thioredoxin reductase (NADPH)